MIKAENHYDQIRSSIWRRDLGVEDQLEVNSLGGHEVETQFALFGYYKVAVPKNACGGEVALPLSEREKQVLFLSSSGRTTAEISEKINVSESTVATYKRRILIKLGCRSMPEAAALATAYALGAKIMHSPETVAH